MGTLPDVLARTGAARSTVEFNGQRRRRRRRVRLRRRQMPAQRRRQFGCVGLRVGQPTAVAERMLCAKIIRFVSVLDAAPVVSAGDAQSIDISTSTSTFHG